MALMECHFYSEALGFNTTMSVILPQETTSQIGLEGAAARKGKYPTLYLLHGLSDDHSIWLRRTGIERYVSSMGIAVVMPQVHRSFYTDMKYGYRYWTFLSEELPALSRQFFPLSERREDTFVAGLSMGGYGAFKWALRRPDSIAAAASLSGALNVARREDAALFSNDFKLIYGEESPKGTEEDLLHLLQTCDKAEGPKPKLYQCCGTEDFLYAENQDFLEAVRDTSIEHEYHEGPGDHTWEYWDEHIQHVLKWLPLK
ncbi:alpha/beta hydrolase [Paenibacillus marinisediminis]